MSGGGIERERGGAWEQGREGNFKGGSIFTNQPFTNRPLRLGAPVKEGRVKGRVDEGNERGKDRTRHGRREGKRGGRK